MLGISTKFGIFLSVIFLLTVGMIRAQPFDNAEAEGFFTPPEGCLEPCFMGIRPGITSIDEATILLWQQGWTQERLRDREVADFSELDTGERYFAIPGQRIKLHIKKNVVRVVEMLQTPFRLGNIWLLLGTPDMVYGYIDSQGRVIRNLVYFEGTVSIGYVLRSCSVLAPELAHTETKIVWSNIKFDAIHPTLEPSFYTLRDCKP